MKTKRTSPAGIAASARRTSERARSIAAARLPTSVAIASPARKGKSRKCRNRSDLALLEGAAGRTDRSG